MLYNAQKTECYIYIYTGRHSERRIGGGRSGQESKKKRWRNESNQKLVEERRAPVDTNAQDDHVGSKYLRDER